MGLRINNYPISLRYQVKFCLLEDHVYLTTAQSDYEIFGYWNGCLISLPYTTSHPAGDAATVDFPVGK